MEREYMEFDVVIVGAGPAGLSAACRLKQKAADAGQEISVCVVEKGSEVGAHILSGAVFEPRALNELFPDWKELGAPLNTPVKRDDIYLLKTAEAASKLPNALVPKTMHNEGNYIISLGNLCRWLAQQAENLGVEIYPGFAAQEALIDENGIVRGIVTGDLGVDREGNPKEGMYTPGMELRAKYTLFAEGCRGHIGKQLINRFQLNANVDPQHYAIGIKELWDIDPAKHEQGLVVHTAGWPLNDENTGGSFLYHLENNQVVVGLIVDLSYSNPHLSPFDEFQRFKHHPEIAQHLEGLPGVGRVRYPFLPSHPQHELAARQMNGRFGGMVTVLIDGDLERTKRVLERVQVFTLAESLGGVESLVNHPAIMTHASVPKEVREKGGITDSLIRLSVGVEDIDDLIADLDQAIG